MAEADVPKHRLRDWIYSRAQNGEITPAQAEAEAKSNGLEPFASKPTLPAFDPMLEPRWTITMAVAWIAWRDLEIVRDNCPGIRSEWWYWTYREERIPVDGGKSFDHRAGWILEPHREASTVWLSLTEATIKAELERPASAQMSASEAEKALWRRLSEGALIAEALNEQGRPIEIPARDWSYLKLFDDGRRDVLRFEALDPTEPYTQVKFRRDDLLRLWPAAQESAGTSMDAEAFIEPSMLEPLQGPERAGYVPLCAAIHWIATDGGLHRVRLFDLESWSAAIAKLRPLIASGEFEVIGLPRGGGLAEAVAPAAFALVKILPPIPNSLGDILVSSASHVNCNFYVGEAGWRDHFNDGLYVSGERGPAWTHLQVKKSDILRRWPKAESRVNLETGCQKWLEEQMRTHSTQPSPKAGYLKESSERFPGLAKRQFERAWTAALFQTKASGWGKSGRPKSRRKTPKNGDRT